MQSNKYIHVQGFACVRNLTHTLMIHPQSNVCILSLLPLGRISFVFSVFYCFFVGRVPFSVPSVYCFFVGHISFMLPGFYCFFVGCVPLPMPGIYCLPVGLALSVKIGIN